MTEKLLFSTNAKEWSDEFVRTHGGDLDLMTTWFSSAIETGRGAGILQGSAMVRKQVQAAVDEIDGPCGECDDQYETCTDCHLATLARHTGVTPTEVTR